MALTAAPSFVKPPNHRLVHCLNSSHCPLPSLLVFLLRRLQLTTENPVATSMPAWPLCCLHLATPSSMALFTLHTNMSHPTTYKHIHTHVYVLFAEMQIMAGFQKDGGKQSCLDSGLNTGAELRFFLPWRILAPQLQWTVQKKPIPVPPPGRYSCSFFVCVGPSNILQLPV